jgi:hypothetical protein
MATAKNKKKRKEEAYPWKAGASSGHTTNLKQSILRLLISMMVSRPCIIDQNEVNKLMKIMKS